MSFDRSRMDALEVGRESKPAAPAPPLLMCDLSAYCCACRS